MRVGLFTESYDPIINGVSTSVKTLASELQGTGHEPTIVAPRYPGFQDDENGLLVRRMPSLRTLFNPHNPMVPPPIGPPPAALKGADFDIVHTHHPFGLGMHGRLWARRLGVPLVSTNHTLYREYTHYFPLVPKRTAQAFVSATMRRYYNSCDLVVVPSRAAARILEDLGVTVPVRVVPTGVPPAPAVLAAAKEQVAKTYALRPNTPLLLYVGRLAREKNLDLLIDVFTRVCEAYGGVADPPVLLLVGSGPYAETCRRRVRAAGVETQVRFAGFLPRSLIAPIYSAATLFVFPSGTETQGVVLSEAQSHGLPCVVVGAGGAPEFVRPDIDALVVPPEAAAFAGAVLALLRDDARRRAFADAALASPLRPTPAEMARQMIALYESARSAQAVRAAR